MANADWQKVREVFDAALRQKTEERQNYIKAACGNDDDLLMEVESLFSSLDESDEFMETPAVAHVADEFKSDIKTLEPGTRFGHYEVVRQIGSGGMGHVYLAQDKKLDRQVAVKILNQELSRDESNLKRFVREAKAASALDHPNILVIHEIGEENHVHYIVSEFIKGQALRDVMNERTLELSEVLDISIQVASALAAAHEARLLHRDIKPDNIMIRPDGYVKLLDFGLAKLVARTAQTFLGLEESTIKQNQTAKGLILGTVNYMSPEQAKGETIDTRTDIFSLGVVIYEMVAGRTPFAGDSLSETLANLLKADPQPLSRFAKNVPDVLQHIVSKALCKNRDERYQNTKDLLADLKTLRERLQFGAELERSTPPREGAASEEFRIPPSGGGVFARVTYPPEGGTLHVRPASSAEYLVGKIKQHKIAALISLIVIGIAILGTSVYFRARNSAVAIESIAVLPFVNQNNDPNTDYLADGIPESIINSLSQLPNLKVMSRNSVFHYRGKDTDAQAVAKELRVQAVLTGRVTQRGDGLVISVELINAQDNSQIWGQQYNRKLADVFAVQEEIARGISEKLRLKLIGAEQQHLAKRQTESLRAFQYYVQARAYTQRRTREDLLMAVRHCEKAIEEDRNYALAYAGLADAYAVLGSRGYIAPIEGRRKAEEAGRKALELDENLAEAHLAFGQTYFQFVPYNFSLSDRELRRAIELSPSLALAHLYLGVSLVEQGRLDEGLEELLKARELDPLSSIIARQAAIPYYLKRDYSRALELLKQANELGPIFTSTWEIGAYIQNRSFDEALAELEKAKRERKSDPILIYGTGMVYAAQGKRAEALQIIKELEEMSGASLSQSHWIAKIYGSLNENKMAFSWLERGLSAGAIGYFYKDEPVWDPIRNDPHFADLLRRMGIP